MVVEEKFIGIQCDNCLEFSDNGDGGEFFADELTAQNNAMENEWHKTDDGKHYCTDCHYFDDKDVLVIGHAEKVEHDKIKFDESLKPKQHE